jgi:hypothetical protein
MRLGFTVAGEHGQARFLPALARHGPVLAGKVEEDGGLGDVLRVVLGLPGIDRINDVGILLVDGDLQPGPVVGIFLGHPVAGLHPILGSDVHLGPEDAVHAGADLHLPRGEPLGEQQPAQVAEHNARVDPERTVNPAAGAAGALGKRRVHGHLHEGVVDLALAADHLAERALDLVRRHLPGVLVVGEIIKAGLGAQPAVRADVEPGAGSRLAGLLDQVPQRLRVDVQVVHLLVVLLAALVGQQRLQLLQGRHLVLVAENSFGHGVILWMVRFRDPGGPTAPHGSVYQLIPALFMPPRLIP